MKITVELPDDTITGFVNVVSGSSCGLMLRTIVLSSDEIESKFASYKTAELSGER